MSRSFFVSVAFLLTLASATALAQIATVAVPLEQATVTAPTPALSSSLTSDSTHESMHHGEDWTTIDLAKSGLPLNPPGALLVEKVKLPGGCTRELLRMQWRPNDPIDLYVIRPASTDKLPVALFLYNYIFDENVFQEDRWCARAVENKFAVVGFPSALSWPRLHAPRPMKQWFVSELPEALATSSHDVQLMLNYLESRSDLDVRHVGMFGQGSGGAIAILAAAADRRIAVLDLMDPWGDWPDWLQYSAQVPEAERASYVNAEFLNRVSGLDPVAYLPQLKGKSVRIQQVLADTVTPPVARDKIDAISPATVVINRYPTREAELEALGTNGILGWLGTELRTLQPK
jgi:hypothetical protein